MVLDNNHGKARWHTVDVPTTFSPNVKSLEVLHTFGVTADPPTNTYSVGKPLDNYARQLMGKRVDYVLC